MVTSPFDELFWTPYFASKFSINMSDQEKKSSKRRLQRIWILLNCFCNNFVTNSNEEIEVRLCEKKLIEFTTYFVKEILWKWIVQIWHSSILTFRKAKKHGIGIYFYFTIYWFWNKSRRHFSAILKHPGPFLIWKGGPVWLLE